MKITLTNTYIGKSSNIYEYARNSRKFLLDNVHRITFDHDVEKKLLSTRDSMSHTTMSELYQQAMFENKLDMFRLLILDKVDKIPSYFLISWLDIDTLELRDTDKQSADILNTISEYRDKVLIDVTPYYSKKKQGISDTTSFYSRIVRALLSRSYYKSDKMWLTPNIIYLLAKFYSTIISSKIGKIYNFTYQEQAIAATALTVFFVNRCTEYDEVINPMMGKMDFLRKVIDTKPIYDYITENFTVNTFDLNAVVKVITEFGPARVGTFTVSTLYSMNANLTSNQIISLIALEYPPYWCHTIISALSGDKTSMYHSIKSLNLKADALAFQNELLKTNSFIRSL